MNCRVELAVVVEDRPTHLALGPGGRFVVGIEPVAAGVELVAIAGRVEEVEPTAAGGAVTGRAGVDRHTVVGAGVGALAQLVPVVDPVGDVMESAVGAGEECDVVGRVVAFQE